MSLLTESAGTMTLGQYISEAKFFGYSKEYQDLLKECYELDLMERYLESQEVLQEMKEMSEWGLLTEADESVLKQAGQEIKDKTDSTLKKIGSEVKEKTEGIWEKIKKFFSNIWKAIKTFFSRMVHFWSNGHKAKKYDELKEKAEQLEKDLAEANIKNAGADRYIADIAKKINEELAGDKGLIDRLLGKKVTDLATVGSYALSTDVKSAKKEIPVDALVKLLKSGKYDEEAQSLAVLAMACEKGVKVTLPVYVASLKKYAEDITEIITQHAGAQINGNDNRYLDYVWQDISSKEIKYKVYYVDQAFFKETLDVITKVSEETEKAVAVALGKINEVNSKNDTMHNKAAMKTIADNLTRLMDPFNKKVAEAIQLLNNLSKDLDKAAVKMDPVLADAYEGLRKIKEANEWKGPYSA